MLTHEPKHNTYTWTLDYKYNSDFGEEYGLYQPQLKRYKHCDDIIVEHTT